MKIKRVSMGGLVADSWRHWCPGCQRNHVIYTDPRAQPNGHFWTFDGNEERPTFSPSINIVGQCHYFIREGMIQYCSDSKHALAGITVPMPDLKLINEDWD